MKELNLIYTDQREPAHITYSNDVGHVWASNAYKNNMPNIAMNYYSAVKILPNDSILIIEPLCVSEQNYNISFLKKFKYIFTWATKPFENSEVANKIIHVNLPSYKGGRQITKEGWLPWTERSDEIVFIANNKSSPHPSELYSLRAQLADWLYKNSKFKVSWYGNMPIRKPYYKGNIQDKSEILKRVKFSVCIENSYDPVYAVNYLSEKLPDVWLSGAVPIYMGCSNMDEVGISNDNYIDLLPIRSNFSKLEEMLQSFSEENYIGMTDSYIQLSELINKITSYENMFDIMLNTY